MTKRLLAFPVAPGQRRLWFLQRYQPDSAAYNNARAYRVQGDIDLAAVGRAVRRISQRHDALRTSLGTFEGRPVQLVHDELPVVLENHVVRDEDMLARRLRRDASRPFDLECGPLLRVGAYHLRGDVVLLFCLHHVVSDGWSFDVLFQEFGDLYDAEVAGRADGLPELPIQYPDYAAWHLEQVASDAMASEVAWWTERLTGFPNLELPTDRPRPTFQSHAGASHRFEIDADLLQGIVEFSRRTGSTPFVVIMAAYQAVIHRLSGQARFVVGTPVAGRPAEELEPLIGVFINLIGIRAEVDGTMSFRRFVDQVRGEVFAAFEHDEAPFDLVVEALELPRDLSRTPVYQAMLTQVGAITAPRFGDAEVHQVTVDVPAAQTDVSLYFEESSGTYQCRLEYATALFDAASAKRFAGAFLRVLQEGVRRPSLAVGELPLLSAAQRQQIVEGFNDTARAWGKSEHVLDLIEEVAGLQPGEIAISAEDAEFTYQQLVERARTVAGYLGRRGVEEGDFVAVCLPPCALLAVSILALWELGAAYVPIDPAYPQARIEFMVTDSRAKLVLASASTKELLPAAAGVVDLESEWEDAATSDPGRGALRNGSQAAYAIYTSGSTGTPKGVVIEHANLSNFLLSMAESPGLGRRDVIFSVTTPSFDIFGLELFLPLVVGARVFFPPRSAARDLTRMAELVDDSGATVLQATPSMLSILSELGSFPPVGLRVFAGGEPLPPALASLLAGRAAELWNLYGPTETTIWSTAHQIIRGEAVLVGRPIANTQVLVLDQRGEVQPVGVPGEVFIGGLGVARGYHERPALNAERFVPNPYRPGERMYRTGDRGRWRADGTLELFGRLDAQVKLRGHRIELGEVESALAGLPGVRQAAAALREDPRGDDQLVGYVVGDVDPAVLRQLLRESLSEIMVPAVIVVMDALPRTPNGKTDRKALPTPEAEGRQQEGAPARTELEAAVLRIWRRLLGDDGIGIHDNFFDAGGHSLLAAKTIHALRTELDLDAPLQAIFVSPTVASLADRLGATSGSQPPGESLQTATIAQLRQESRLGDDITPGAAAAPGPPRHFLVTGASGFVGGSVVAELLDHDPTMEVTCLVRSGDADRRGIVQAALQASGRWRSDFAARLHIVAGDIEAPGLGMDREVSAHVKATIHGVIHSAALVDFARPYSMLRGPNVLGTLEVLRFCAAGPMTPLHFVSTLTAFPSLMDRPMVTVHENAPIELSTDSVLHGAYAQSKWVSDEICRRARERGIPVSTYRMGVVGPDSMTGVGRDTDFIHLLVRGCVTLGSTPVIDSWLNVTPIDHVTRVFRALLLDPNHEPAAFHLTSPVRLEADTFMGWMRTYGYQLKHRVYAEWFRRLERTIELERPNALLALLPYLPRETPEVWRQVWYDDSNVQERLGRLGEAPIPPFTEARFRTWFDALCEKGFLPPTQPTSVSVQLADSHYPPPSRRL